MRHLAILAGAAVSIAAQRAHANPDDLFARADLQLERSQVGWGPTVGPDRVSLATESGWDGAAGHVVIDASLEATLLRRASLFVGVSYGEVEGHTRPSIGAAYQLIDPRTSRTGARISLAYKPEGFDEPEGELESVFVLSRRFDGKVARAMVAYGRDPEGREADAELGASFVQRATSRWFFGASVRGRYGIAVRPGEPAWDLVAGGMAGFELGRSRIEVLGGTDTLAAPPARTGPLGLIGVESDL